MNNENAQTMQKYLDLFEKKAFAHLATLMKDGSPQVSPVRVDYDGTHLLVNTARGRQKHLNIRRDSRVALSIQDPDEPFRKLLVRGRVVEQIEEGAEEHIDRLARRYTGDVYKLRVPNMVRVILKIKPEYVTG